MTFSDAIQNLCVGGIFGCAVAFAVLALRTHDRLGYPGYVCLGVLVMAAVFVLLTHVRNPR